MDYSYAVRPALHLNLKSAVPSTASALSASIVGSGGSLDKTSDISFGTSDIATFTYTTNTNYCINNKAISINNTAVSINESKPSTYSTVGSVQYKCWRSANKVMVEVTNVSSATTIKGTVSTLWSVESKDSTLSIQSKTDRENWFTSYAKIVATFTQNQNVRLCVDGVYKKLEGANSNGAMTVNNGKATFSHSIYENYISIELTLPNGPHAVSLDHFTGASASIDVSVVGGTATETIKDVDTDLRRIIIIPDNSGMYVNSITIDNYNVIIEYYEAYVYGVGYAVSIRYIAKDQNNSFVVEIRGLYGDMSIAINLANVAPTLKKPVASGGTQITGTVATASVGGEVRMVGNAIADAEDTDTVTFVAVAYAGYKFAGWVNANDETEVFGTEDQMSIRLTKEQINGKIVKALFTKNASNEFVNSDTDDNGASGLL